MYGLPTPDGLLKVGEHHTGAVIDPDAQPDAPDPAAWERFLAWVRTRLLVVVPTPVASTTCLYAAYPDDMFVMDRAGPVVIGLGFSGHGFKFVRRSGAASPIWPTASTGRTIRSPSNATPSTWAPPAIADPAPTHPWDVQSHLRRISEDQPSEIPTQTMSGSAGTGGRREVPSCRCRFG